MKEIKIFCSFLLRWNHYDFYQDTCEYQGNEVNLAGEVNLHSYSAVARSSVQFPKTKRLILSQENSIQNSSFILDLTRVFSPVQLTELVILDGNLRLEQLLSLLYHFPHLQSLTIPTSILNLSSPQSEINRLTFNKNNLVKIALMDLCTLEDIQILTRFCPYLQSLEVEAEKENLDLILGFLLLKNPNQNHQNRLLTCSRSKDIIFWQREYYACIRCTRNQNLTSFQLPCNHRLSSVCFRNVNYGVMKKLQTRIDQDRLLNDYSLEYLDQNMYIWW